MIVLEFYLLVFCNDNNVNYSSCYLFRPLSVGLIQAAVGKDIHKAQ